MLKKLHNTPTAAGKKPEKKAKQKIPGGLLKIIGLCLLAVGVLASFEPVIGLIEGWSYYLEDLLTAVSFAAAGGSNAMKNVVYTSKYIY